MIITKPILLIVGYGKMGQTIYQLDNNTHQKLIIDPVGGHYKDVTDFWKKRNIIDGQPLVAIDFSSPSVIMGNIHCYADYKINAVIGTTGWANEPEKMKQVKSLVKTSEIGLIYSSNFSTSAQMAFIANRILATMANKVSGWDVAISETHHNKKTDISGSAKRLAENIIEGHKLGKTGIVTDVTGGKDDDKITISSSRLQGIFGEHTVQYAHTDGDRINLFHHADSRNGFADGALWAAEFINGKKWMYDYSEVMLSSFFPAIKKDLMGR